MLTEETTRRLEPLFAPEDQPEAIKLLVTRCGNNLSFLERYTPVELERFQFAALKLSAGTLSKLREAVALAEVDWRDLLVVAGFANSVTAHLS
jgi:hypothetical protein